MQWFLVYIQSCTALYFFDSKAASFLFTSFLSSDLAALNVNIDHGLRSSDADPIDQVWGSNIFNKSQWYHQCHIWTLLIRSVSSLWTFLFIPACLGWRKMHDLKVVSYALLGGLPEDSNLVDSLSGSSEELFRRGKRRTRKYRSFCWKTKQKHAVELQKTTANCKSQKS